MTPRPWTLPPCAATSPAPPPPGTASSTTSAAAIASGIATVRGGSGDRDANATSWPARRHASPIVAPMLPLPITAILVMDRAYGGPARRRARSAARERSRGSWCVHPGGADEAGQQPHRRRREVRAAVVTDHQPPERPVVAELDHRDRGLGGPAGDGPRGEHADADARRDVPADELDARQAD